MYRRRARRESHGSEWTSVFVSVVDDVERKRRQRTQLVKIIIWWEIIEFIQIKSSLIRRLIRRDMHSYLSHELRKRSAKIWGYVMQRSWKDRNETPKRTSAFLYSARLSIGLNNRVQYLKALLVTKNLLPIILFVLNIVVFTIQGFVLDSVFDQKVVIKLMYLTA